MKALEPLADDVTRMLHIEALDTVEGESAPALVTVETELAPAEA